MSDYQKISPMPKDLLEGNDRDFVTLENIVWYKAQLARAEKVIRFYGNHIIPQQFEDAVWAVMDIECSKDCGSMARSYFANKEKP